MTNFELCSLLSNNEKSKGEERDRKARKQFN